MKAKDFDRIFDEGKEDVLQYVDLSKARRINQETKRVNVDFPSWMVRSLDDEASRLGITRQSVIKTWVAEKIAETTGRNAPEKTRDAKVARHLAESRKRYRAKPRPR